MTDIHQLLIVDDTETNLDILVEALSDNYEVSVAIDGEGALEALEDTIPDLVLLDIMMPGMDGYEVLDKMKNNQIWENIPVIFLTAMTDIQDKTRGFQLGAVDYITKPFEISEVKARVKTQLTLKDARDFLDRQNELLEERVCKRTRELQNTRDITIAALASLAETRDNETGGHIFRTQEYVKLLAVKLRKEGHFQGLLTTEYIDLLYKSAPLHDIGKVGIKDAILLKPGKLTEDEFDAMKEHTTLGAESLERAGENKDEIEFLVLAEEIALTHHEKWDGSGYPHNLEKEYIPLSGRLMALADVYDALTTKRVYKPAFDHEKAVNIIKEGKGTHFDPLLTDLFCEIQEEFRQIAEKFAD